MSEEKYVIYEYINGRKSGRRFVDLSSTHYENGDVIRRFDSITKREVAERIVNNHNKKINFGLIQNLMDFIFD